MWPRHLADVRGQPQARRALEIAAAGGRSLLMVGPPGAGKTMLASRLPGLLAPMSRSQALEVAAIASITAGGFDIGRWGQRPFRGPRHTAWAAALVDGGSMLRPGEITLAHRGALFLDELPDFDRRVLEVLREPLESGHIVISRAARQAKLPAAFELTAAMSLCPCGYLGDPSERCHWTPERVERYRGRISGPLLDRINTHLHVAPITKKVLMGVDEPREGSNDVQSRVIGARVRSEARQGRANTELTAAEIDRYCRPAPAAAELLARADEQLSLSARG